MRVRARRLGQRDGLDQVERPHERESGSGGSARSRRFIHRLGQVIAVLGVLVIGWSVYIYFYGDPITALYQDWRQHQLAHQLNSEFKSFKPPVPLSTPGQKAPSAAAIHAAAESFSHQAHQGEAIGRIEIPRIHISKVVVNGTRWAEDLSRGPGRYPQSSWPGLGKVTAIAGHRTTFGAPFRHINDLASGNRIVLLMPYGTFTYRVFAHEIVRNNDWSILHKRRFDTLVLSACHPLYSASHRWVVFARLVSVAAPARVK
ncbi:MAG: class E sortase [Gaiellaceae bacterium]